MNKWLVPGKSGTGEAAPRSEGKCDLCPVSRGAASAGRVSLYFLVQPNAETNGGEHRHSVAQVAHSDFEHSHSPPFFDSMSRAILFAAPKAGDVGSTMGSSIPLADGALSMELV